MTPGVATGLLLKEDDQQSKLRSHDQGIGILSPWQPHQEMHRKLQCKRDDGLLINGEFLSYASRNPHLPVGFLTLTPARCITRVAAAGAGETNVPYDNWSRLHKAPPMSS